ncbi:uncharacterized protein [Eurosta solidaginis]|uniref:uncharacterized protein isoform X2 n=1 Tax=Eurosta solidaginis TaxID=178769 RepID=UPI0035317AF8
MDIPKLQPITNKLKTNASAAGNASKGGGGDAAGTSHVGNNHFNKSGAGYGLNYNANDTSNQFPIGDRRYNYNGTGRRDFITDRRKDQYQNRLEPYRPKYGPRTDQTFYYTPHWNNKNRYKTLTNRASP